ncbi:hypothetical protein P7L68_02585 (plasmid) [Tistrella mobilis]|uniref:calcium-binding protein n=1 Tax=Tistrella mobilis TaxID=171437 RepID=UPI003555C606
MEGLAGNDVITFGNDDGLVYGGDGDDIIYLPLGYITTMDGGDGYDIISCEDSTTAITLHYDPAGLQYSENDLTASIEEIRYTDFDDWISAPKTVQVLRGGGGDDYFRARGQRLYDGGEGNDTIAFAGIQTLDYGDWYLTDLSDPSRFISVENVMGVNYIKDWIIGSADNNVLQGLSGDDVIEGGAGADTMAGGAGRDTLSYAGSESAVYVDLAERVFTGGDANGDWASGFEILRGSDYNDMLGEVRSSTNWISEIYGGGGDDILRPVSMTIMLDGGEDWDTVSYSRWTSGVIVDMAESFSKYINIEQINGTAYSDQLNGTNAVETFLGFAGDDILRGRGGADLLDGRGGTDIATYSDSAEAVRIDLGIGLGSGGDAEGDRLISIENVNGSAFNDTLEGDGGANHFIGFAGDDTLRGRGGADILDGRDGIDVATYSTSTTGVHIDLALGQGFGGEAEGDRLISIEIVNGSMHDDTLEGGADDDTLRGFDGNDILRGRGGADVLDGRTGSDIATYSDSNAAVQVDLAYGTGTGGHAQGDQLISVEGVNGSAFDDVLQGSLSSDALRGFDGNDTLRGRDGNDILDGRNGKDVIVGGHGADLLLGGAGADRFVYSSITESTKTLSGRDTILDFSHTQGDRIDLSPVDANVTLSGNQTFTFIGTAAYSGTAGQVRYAITAEGTIVYADTDGDRISDMTILLNGNHALTAADFVL